MLLGSATIGRHRSHAPRAKIQLCPTLGTLHVQYFIPGPSGQGSCWSACSKEGLRAGLFCLDCIIIDVSLTGERGRPSVDVARDGK